MKILTLIRQVPDAESGLRIVEDAVDLAGASLVIDTMDEYGVEQALRLREAQEPGAIEVIAVAVGPAKNEEALRGALALGADRAIHVRADAMLDAIALSKVIAEIATRESAELVLCGGRESDWDSEALGAAVAERLQWPQLTWTTQLTMQGNELQGRHDRDNGSEGFKVELPAVVTTQQGLNEPRFPTLPNIVKARKKELRTETLDSFDAQPLVRSTKVEVQSRQRLRRIVTMDGDALRASAEVAQVLLAEIGAKA